MHVKPFATLHCKDKSTTRPTHEPFHATSYNSTFNDGEPGSNTTQVSSAPAELGCAGDTICRKSLGRGVVAIEQPATMAALYAYQDNPYREMSASATVENRLEGSLLSSSAAGPSAGLPCLSPPAERPPL